MPFLPTPSQTVGPFFSIGLAEDPPAELVDAGDPDALTLEGVVYDGEGEPVVDAVVEIWQANRAGRYDHPEDTREEIELEEGFQGFGRCGTDAEGRYSFVTVKPGPVPSPEGGLQAPHILVSVFARGLLKRVATRVYFPDEAEANGADPVLTSVEDEAQRTALVAVPVDGGLTFDIHLQGDSQTAFFGV
ncbi:MAG TPA: protocatechuate 3,4-dioxygenase subunit alpha [Thermoleophilaceae bacterium]